MSNEIDLKSVTDTSLYIIEPEMKQFRVVKTLLLRDLFKHDFWFIHPTVLHHTAITYLFIIYFVYRHIFIRFKEKVKDPTEQQP